MDRSVAISFEPVVVKKASEEIVEQVQDSILNHTLKPGDTLPPERELIKMFGRSRPTVREALRVLELKGLIATTNGGSTVICKPGIEQLEDTLRIMFSMYKITSEEIYDVRNSLEMSAVELAAERRTDEDIECLQSIIQDEIESIEDIERFIHLDRDFHERIAEAANNNVFVILICALREPLEDRIRESISRIGLDEYRKEQKILIEGHKNILNSIVRQSKEEVTEHMKQHIEQFMRINTL